MKRSYSFYLSILTGFLILLASSETIAQDNKPNKRLAGSWAGSLSVQGVELRLVANISFNENDSMIVTFDSPDQGVKEIPSSKVVLSNDSIFISVKKIGGKFSGKIQPDFTALDGNWNQSGMSFPLKLAHQDKPFILNRPQEPKPPLPYRSVDVTFSNPQAGIDLAGTLTIPEKEGIYPVAILVSGSGPQNRDEELLGHKPFLVLADYLTRQGIAVLRYDDRGVGKSGGIFKTATTCDFATDAEAAIEFLKKRQGIDSTRIGIIGHSEGGLIAPIVASSRVDVAFIVLMAAPGLTGERILLTQSALISAAEGSDEVSIRAAEKINGDIYSVLKKNRDNDRAATKIRALFASADKKYAADTSYHKMSETELTLQIETLTSPWFRCFLTLDPEPWLSKVKCPILAINGSLDLQVSPRENLEAIEKAMIFGGNSSYVIEEIPGLNHLFQTANTGSPAEYNKIEETISPVALELIGKWIHTSLPGLK
ncbi:MAG: alpha/beta hydrolase [Bacteroidetes bacterium]|nr:alpha/beta hydrolase [Bacteroidota bacterium]